jgi:hypothetical protein
MAQSCPKLQRLVLGGVTLIPDWHWDDTTSVAASIIGCISAPFKIGLDIEIQSRNNDKIWKSEEVTGALEKLKKNAGHVMKFV